MPRYRTAHCKPALNAVAMAVTDSSPSIVEKKESHFWSLVRVLAGAPPDSHIRREINIIGTSRLSDIFPPGRKAQTVHFELMKHYCRESLALDSKPHAPELTDYIMYRAGMKAHELIVKTTMTKSLARQQAKHTKSKPHRVTPVQVYTESPILEAPSFSKLMERNNASTDETLLPSNKVNSSPTQAIPRSVLDELPQLEPSDLSYPPNLTTYPLLLAPNYVGKPYSNDLVLSEAALSSIRHAVEKPLRRQVVLPNPTLLRHVRLLQHESREHRKLLQATFLLHLLLLSMILLYLLDIPQIFSDPQPTCWFG